MVMFLFVVLVVSIVCAEGVLLKFLFINIRIGFSMINNVCSRKGCVRENGLIYLGVFMCWYHWDQKCAREDQLLDDEKIGRAHV